MDIIHIGIDENQSLVFEISIWTIIALAIILLVYFIIVRRRTRYDLVKLDIKLGNIGSAEFRPNKTDLQIAHKIWTELVTRKAAIPIDLENDVIDKLYASWYALFQKIRQYISEIPADKLRRDKSTRELVKIAIQTLNNGLRPHLTRWQARYSAWHDKNKEELKDRTPQEIQREFPEYEELIADLKIVNDQLIEYSVELKKIIDG